MMNEMTGRSRGLAYITYEHEHDAADAKDRTHGLELNGTRIRVDFPMNKRANPPTPRTRSKLAVSVKMKLLMPGIEQMVWKSTKVDCA